MAYWAVVAAAVVSADARAGRLENLPADRVTLLSADRFSNLAALALA